MFRSKAQSTPDLGKTTSWIKFNLWGKRGEGVFPYLKDKTQVCVSGELANRKYTDKDGQERYSLEVRVNDLTLVGGKQDSSQSQQSNEYDQTPPQRQPPPKSSANFDDLESDIPF